MFFTGVRHKIFIAMVRSLGTLPQSPLVLVNSWWDLILDAYYLSGMKPAILPQTLYLVHVVFIILTKFTTELRCVPCHQPTILLPWVMSQFVFIQCYIPPLTFGCVAFSHNLHLGIQQTSTYSKETFFINHLHSSKKWSKT